MKSGEGVRGEGKMSGLRRFKKINKIKKYLFLQCIGTLHSLGVQILGVNPLHISWELTVYYKKVK